MKVEYINPFIGSVITVFREVLPEITITRGQLQVSSSPMGTKGCAALIGITGQLEGRVILDMSKETAIKIAGVMNNEAMTQFDSMVASTINELANMISGGAITALNNMGAHFDITAPTMFTGPSITLYDGSSLGEAVIIPLATNYGEFYINVAIKD